ncbi:unnamed protein product [Brassicogethes aeneus]|uniref:LisH domain-containing protein n=1 Tax=Brassicogethes aeneus TaxID=1431903 RepID=A0A9P0BDZ2_BRAAE|nr:unnamed protein product [Brassicogethes aeneus]
MDICFCNYVAKEDLLGVYKTILTFLESQNFKETAKTFKQECLTFGVDPLNKTCSGTESLESALEQVMKTLKKIEYTILNSQKELDISNILEEIAHKIKKKNVEIIECDDNKDIKAEAQLAIEEPTKIECITNLDFSKLKYDMGNSITDVQMQLLRALRWGILENNKEERTLFLDLLIKNDILQLKSPDENFVGFFLKTNRVLHLQESMCRLVNTIASLKSGRDYLTSTDTFIQVVLFPNLLRQNISNICKEMLIATLQKLSLRSASRYLMIRFGMLEFIIDFLDESADNASIYCLEYCSALLMNLCLEQEGRDRCAQMAKNVVAILKKLLLGEMACCLPCVNGTLFSILVDKKVNEEARVQKLDQLLTYIAKTSEDESIQKQIGIILYLRFHGNVEPLSEDITNQELENEEEFLEKELDMGDVTHDQNYKAILQPYAIKLKNQEEPHIVWFCKPMTPACVKSKIYVSRSTYPEQDISSKNNKKFKQHLG